MWFLYVVRCTDGSLYCGIARNVTERIAQHDAGRGAKYTRGRGPVTIEAVRRCASHGNALRLELAVKRLPRHAKEALVRDVAMFRSLQRKITSNAKAKAKAKASSKAKAKKR